MLGAALGADSACGAARALGAHRAGGGAPGALGADSAGGAALGAHIAGQERWGTFAEQLVMLTQDIESWDARVPLGVWFCLFPSRG